MQARVALNRHHEMMKNREKMTNSWRDCFSFMSFRIGPTYRAHSRESLRRETFECKDMKLTRLYSQYWNKGGRVCSFFACRHDYQTAVTPVENDPISDQTHEATLTGAFC